MAIDMAKLDALLFSMGWTRGKLERATGIQISNSITDKEKQLIWAIIQTPEALEIWTLFHLFFPEAIITRINDRF